MILFVFAWCFVQNDSQEKQVQDIVNTSQITTQEAITEKSWVVEWDQVLEAESIQTDEAVQLIEISQIRDSITQEWVYENYRPELIWNTDVTVIFFAATWCPSCVAADINLSASDIPSWITILKADFDSEIDLRREYWVVTQHTFVSVDTDGKQLRKWVGGTTIDDIIEKL